MGYGTIQPKNCYVGGEATNCKVHAKVLNVAKGGRVPGLWFLETDDRYRIEKELGTDASRRVHGLKTSEHREVRRVAFALIPIVGWVRLPSANRKIAELRFCLYELKRTSGSSE